ncbi:glycosyltransferase family 4 protein [Methylomonas montana]|uniref:glycosyltransferase family 4 protein n=1 Tax=Methylomonas montana TaxID=3058963 RepID=UPI00265820D4|nr:glycosyltransferase family 4 protein [Methylomonas montana]WKJ92347.1 glycosyltransferase family 4 protein [Methylomonas montana]
MRIGLLIYGDMETVSGGYLYNRKLVSYLQSQGEQVTIISLPPRNVWRHLADNFRNDCLQQIAAAEIDILIQDAMVHPSVFLLNRRLGRQLAIPIVALAHLLTSFDHHPCYSAWFYRAIERYYLKSVTGVIANSQTTLAQVCELMDGGLPAHCVAVPAGDNFQDAGVDFNAIQQRALAPGSLRILVVGNLIRRKGLHVLIWALSQLPVEDFRVTVAGRLDMEPGYVEHIRALVSALRLQAQVVLIGPVQGQALADLYRQHHLMVLPSAYESYGIVYLEAQQFGLPVIGTTAGAAKEIIDHDRNGYLIAPEDHRALADLLRKLNQNRELLMQLSRNALIAFTSQPSWDQSCEIIRQYLYAGIE